MIEYKSLEATNIEILHNTFIKAFSDYQVKINISLSDFTNMIKRRGYVSEASMGAFDNGKLVGFLLTGIRIWKGKMTAYDIGTGVVKEYRSHGITSNMFLENKKHIMNMGWKEYLLEVIDNNEKALNLYKKQGFEISRKFDCYKLKKEDYKAEIKSSYSIEKLDLLNKDNISSIKSLMQFEPSWQNSLDSIMTVPDNFICSGVYENEELIAYGVIEKTTGDIVQISVDEDYRRNGIGTNIIANLVDSTNSNNLSMLNVDTKCESMKCFLEQLEFECYVKQYEMILNL